MGCSPLFWLLIIIYNYIHYDRFVLACIVHIVTGMNNYRAKQVASNFQTLQNVVNIKKFALNIKNVFLTLMYIHIILYICSYTCNYLQL